MISSSCRSSPTKGKTRGNALEREWALPNNSGIAIQHYHIDNQFDEVVGLSAGSRGTWVAAPPLISLTPGVTTISLLEILNGSQRLFADALRLTLVQVDQAAPELRYIHADHRGAPTAMTNQTKQVVWRAAYDPFGAASVINNPDGDDPAEFLNLRLPGQYSDSESSLHYNYFRDYDPTIGRYLQSDPIGLEGGVNSYAYANANPLRAVDPHGLLAVLAFHEVALNRCHGKIVVYPDNAERWANHPAFKENGFATFGAGPDDTWNMLSRIVGGVNRHTDVNEVAADCYELTLRGGYSEDEAIQRMLDLTEKFNSGPRPPYTLFPQTPREYNSNGWIHRLGLEAGFWMPFADEIRLTAPGYNNPLPDVYFDL